MPSLSDGSRSNVQGLLGPQRLAFLCVCCHQCTTLDILANKESIPAPSLLYLGCELQHGGTEVQYYIHPRKDI